MQPLIIRPKIFNSCPEIISGISSKIGAGRKKPFFFNLSLNVGDDEKIVIENRNLFFDALNMSEGEAAFQNQIHSDVITYVNSPGNCGQSDAMITDKTGLALAVSIADCTPILIYDKYKKVIAAIHSGWRGTYQKILLKTISMLVNDFHSDPTTLICYIGPSISQINYEVDIEVAEKFPEKYSVKKDHKYLLNVSGINYDYLVEAGVKKCNIQKSVLCTFTYKNIFHSYRRDGKKSGRSLAVICMKEHSSE
jgi:YfiH family protein